MSTSSDAKPEETHSQRAGFWGVVRRSRRVMRAINLGLAAIAAVGMLSIVVLTSVDVVTRKVHYAMGWPYDVILLIFGWAVFMGFGLIESERSNIGVDIFGKFLPVSILRVRAIIMDALALVFIAIVAFLALRYVLHSYHTGARSNSLLSVPIWTMDLAFAVGMTALAVTTILELANDFGPDWRADYADQAEISAELV